ncbi:MAG: glycosyltransferase [Gemmatimonadota bacterium]|nr:glycosyltransferase [Gemmatimonadota bacterium]
MSDRSGLKYVFTGGGSGGHVNPALAIADGVRDQHPGVRIEYIGVRGKIEADLVPKRGYPIHLVHARGLPSVRQVIPLFAFALATGVGVLQCLWLLLRIRPDIVVATGGYASGPVLIALSILRILRLSSAYTFVFEPNVIPGLVNRLAGRVADRIGISFIETSRFFPAAKVAHVGYPVRQEIGSVSREDARIALNVPMEATVIFAFGGSQGARSINRAIIDVLPVLLERKNLHVFHSIGIHKGPEYNAEQDTEARLKSHGLSREDQKRYHRMIYAHNIHTLYAASDIIIGRAGAGTITEICAGGRPSILVPLPNVAGDHQVLNARALETGGAAIVLYEEALIEGRQVVGSVNSRRLADIVLSLADTPEQRENMGEHARQVFDHNGLDRIMNQLENTSCNDADHPPRKTSAFETLETVSGLSPFQLLKRVKSADEAMLEAIGTDYLKYKTDGYLTNQNWTIRNVGVKLVGLLKYTEKIPVLISMLQDRTPVSRLQRIFGGDYQQVGFIRRNIVRTMIQLDQYSPEIRTALRTSFEDPYFEVRSTSAQAVADLSLQVGTDEELVSDLVKLMEDRSFEVVTAAITALGKISDASFIQHARRFYLDSNWKIREAIIRAFADLVTRGVATDYDLLRAEMEDLLVTCVDFKPTFPIKKALNELAVLIEPQHRQE